MAEPLARSAVIRLLEDAVGLIRQAPAGTLVYHWLGSVPFAFTLLFSYSTVTGTRTTDLRWAGESLLLAVLMMWMNCWRAVYAGKLRQHLSGVPDRPWTVGRAFHLGAIQSFFGASKLVVMPLSFLIVFPWAKTIAFYRNLAVLAGREDVAPRQMMSQARRLAGFKPAQNWAVLAVLIFLQAMLTVNLAIVTAVLPQIVRILTGYESAYSRSSIYFVLNPLFVLLVLAVSWVAFDPFVQAIYCVRCFEGESTATGEDLRCGLRRIRSAATPVLGALIVLMTIVPSARADISQTDLDKAVHQAVQAPEYDWRLPPASGVANTPWIVRVMEGPVAAIRRVASAVGEALGRALRWLLRRLFPNSPSQTPGAAPPGMGLDWTVAALIALVAAAGALFAWQRSRARRFKMKTVAPEVAAPVRLDAADLTPDALPEDQWLELAERCLAEQNFRFALRALYLACLAWLGRRKFLSIHAGKTNHEYEKELNRRARGFPGARGLFAGNVAAFERAWYGQHPVSSEDTAAFRQSMEELKATLARPEGDEMNVSWPYGRR